MVNTYKLKLEVVDEIYIKTDIDLWNSQAEMENSNIIKDKEYLQQKRELKNEMEGGIKNFL